MIFLEILKKLTDHRVMPHILRKHGFLFNVLILLSVLVLSACASPLIMAQRFESISTSVHSFNSAASDGIVRIEIHGNPFENNTEAFKSFVAQEFEGSYIGHPARFSINDSHEDFGNTRIVIYFQPARGINRNTICDPDRAPDPSIMEKLSGIKASAAFCVRHSSRTYVTVKGSMPQTYDDLYFADFIKSIARNVIPTARGGEATRCMIEIC